MKNCLAVFALLGFVLLTACKQEQPTGNTGTTQTEKKVNFRDLSKEEMINKVAQVANFTEDQLAQVQKMTADIDIENMSQEERKKVIQDMRLRIVNEVLTEEQLKAIKNSRN